MYSRCAASSTSTRIVRNLSAVNCFMFSPRRVWRKKTRARRVAPDPPGDVGEERRRQDQRRPTRRSGRSPRLTQRAERRQPDGRQADQRQRLDACASATRGPTASNSRGTRSIWTEIAFSLWMISSSSSCRVVRVGDDRPGRRRARRRARELVDAAEQREIADVVAPLLRLRVDEADEPDPVLGMLLELAGDQLADVAGADDDRVLHVDRAAARNRPAAARAERRRTRSPSSRRRPCAACSGRRRA